MDHIHLVVEVLHRGQNALHDLSGLDLAQFALAVRKLPESFQPKLHFHDDIIRVSLASWVCHDYVRMTKLFG